MNNPRIFFFCRKPLISSKRLQEQRINFQRAACIRGERGKKRWKEKEGYRTIAAHVFVVSCALPVTGSRASPREIPFSEVDLVNEVTYTTKKKCLKLAKSESRGGPREREREEKKQGRIIKPNEWEQVDISIERNDGIDDN